MLAEVDDLEAFAEDAWQGTRVCVGEAIVRLTKQVRRCVMTTLDRTRGAGFPTLQALGRARAGADGVYLGVYGDVERPGVVRVAMPWSRSRKETESGLDGRERRDLGGVLLGVS